MPEGASLPSECVAASSSSLRPDLVPMAADQVRRWQQLQQRQQRWEILNDEMTLAVDDGTVVAWRHPESGTVCVTVTAADHVALAVVQPGQAISIDEGGERNRRSGGSAAPHRGLTPAEVVTVAETAIRLTLASHDPAMVDGRPTVDTATSAEVYPGDCTSAAVSRDAPDVAVEPDAANSTNLTRDARRTRRTISVAWYALRADPRLAEAARRSGWDVQRSLLKMSRSATDLVRPPLAEGFEYVEFRPRSQLNALIEVNARAFARHPEQGAMSADDFSRKFGSAQFPIDGVVAVQHTASGRLAAFCWTKVEVVDDSDSIGEIYVIGVDPQFQGRGLGRSATVAGLAFLAQERVDRFVLFVEADNHAAVTLYESLGFGVERRDHVFTKLIESDHVSTT